MLNEKRLSCAFTGHRPQKLPWQFNETNPNCLKLKQILNQQISQLVANGFTDFLSGMAQGTDTWAAEAVLHLRKKSSDLFLGIFLDKISLLVYPVQALAYIFIIIRESSRCCCDKPFKISTRGFLRLYDKSPNNK